MNVRNLLLGLISLGILIHTGPLPCILFWGDYPYPEES